MVRYRLGEILAEITDGRQPIPRDPIIIKRIKTNRYQGEREVFNNGFRRDMEAAINNVAKELDLKIFVKRTPGSNYQPTQEELEADFVIEVRQNVGGKYSSDYQKSTHSYQNVIYEVILVKTNLKDEVV